MPRPDPALLDPARYPFRYAIEPRFSDLDVNLHLNNVAVVDLMQEGRVRFAHASTASEALDGGTLLTVSLAIEYLGEGSRDATVDLHVAILEMGRSSQTLAQLATQNGSPIAYARTVLVSAGKDGPRPIPDSVREAAAAWMLRA